MAKEPDLSIIVAKHKRLLIAVVAFLLLWWAAAKVLTLYADYLWFDSLTYGSVFTTELWAKVTLGVCTFLITALWLAGQRAAVGPFGPEDSAGAAPCGGRVRRGRWIRLCPGRGGTLV